MPTAYQMRPIYATTALFKLIELRFNEKLIHACQNLPRFARFQVGFMPGMSTQVNIVRICNAIRDLYSDPQSLKQPKLTDSLAAVIYIDYSQAYNSIHLQRTLDEIRKESIPDGNETQFLKWIYARQRACLEGEEFNPKLGVPQGGINSPILFNFTLYFVMKKVKERIDQWIEEKLRIYPPEYVQNVRLSVANLFAFADDLAILVSGAKKNGIFSRGVVLIIRILNDESNKWGLFINWEKCAIQSVGHHRLDCKGGLEGIYAPIKLQTKNENTAKTKRRTRSRLTHLVLRSFKDDKNAVYKIPYARVFKYLGIQLTGDLDFNEHSKFLRQKIGYIAYSFTPLRRRGEDLKFDYNMWQLMIRPLLDYSATYSSFDKARKNKILWNHCMRYSIKKMLGWTKGFRTVLVDLMAQYDYYQVPFKSKLMHQHKWNEYLENGRITGDYPSVYIYQKFPAELIPKTFTEIGNIVFSAIKCFHPSHSKTCRVTLTIPHLKDHYPDIPAKVFEINIEQVLVTTIQAAIAIGQSIDIINAIHHKRKIRKNNAQTDYQWEKEEKILKESSLRLAQSREKLDERCSMIKDLSAYIKRLRVYELENQ